MAKTKSASVTIPLVRDWALEWTLARSPVATKLGLVGSSVYEVERVVIPESATSVWMVFTARRSSPHALLLYVLNDDDPREHMIVFPDCVRQDGRQYEYLCKRGLAFIRAIQRQLGVANNDPFFVKVQYA